MASSLKLVKQGVLALFFSTLMGSVVAADYSAMRDPTKPLRFKAETEGLASLSLHSVLISEDRKFAVINGKQVKEQDVINGARVVKIQPGRVRVLINGKEQELIMRAQVKKPAKAKNPA
ncbi:hypothetical protein R50073_31580 [Maricurvus nonylphenolicus]|uniref:hypothetical protein n=1 Tax=Maricurvus nonylphenolicus TaxID=1008307 RepID=UPI0036F320EA